MSDTLDATRDLVAYDWLDTATGHRLHHAHLTTDQFIDMDEERFVADPVRLSCGRVVDWVGIPGVFTRMGAQRCVRCCRRLGYPPGKGSPKNSDECRALLGLDQNGDTDE